MILVIGGSGSGKSAYAEKVALECQKEKRHFYLATMHVFGEEGQKKVERHKRMRAGKGFVTIDGHHAVPSRTSGGRWRRGAPGVHVESGCQ